MGCMIAANRLKRRAVWFAGTGLLVLAVMAWRLARRLKSYKRVSW